MMDRIQTLISRGVSIPAPNSIEIGHDVNPERIAGGVVIHAGCKIFGETTSIGPGCVLGSEAPATIDNCQLGTGVKLKGGFFSGAVFLDGSNMGSGSHVRSGTILEEQAKGAHTVGLKQTILLPFVTLGSLINFCDVMMAGGRSREDHSEVGSSYIHFNYTPQQDKATASLIGDIPRGVMLNQSPIFLGGQGGLVGPVRVNYGCIIGAGVVCRKDVLTENQLYMSAVPEFNGAMGPSVYKSIRRKTLNNLHYIGNLLALEAWYQNIRKPFMIIEDYSSACYEGALANLSSAIEERIKRMGAFVEKLERSVKYWEAQEQGAALAADQKRLMGLWPEMAARIKILREKGVAHPGRETVANSINGSKYIDAVQALDQPTREAGQAWLETYVNEVVGLYTS